MTPSADQDAQEPASRRTGGGERGSVTILTSTDRAAKRALVRDIEAAGPTFRNIPIYLSRVGLRRWESRVGASARAP